jgi:hypothetical protein
MKALGAVCVVIGCAIVRVVSAQSSPPPQHKATIDQYCVTCHNQRLKIGGLALDALDIANLQTNAEAWAASVSGRGAQDQRVRRRRSSHRDGQRHVFGEAGSLAGLPPRRPATRHGGRDARQAAVSRRSGCSSNAARAWT